MNWPMAMPAKKAASVPCVLAGVACRSSPIAGRLDRYMSMDIGAKAVSDPSRITRPHWVFSWLCRAPGSLMVTF